MPSNPGCAVCGASYIIKPPALISFSGGRTSGFMLRQILDAHDGVLPAGVHVTFANTGKERPETLDFVHEVETRWGVHIVWLEYRPKSYAIVNYATASRNGEPFADLIAAKKYLPNPVTRFCTTELKVCVMKKFMLEQRHNEWDCVLGLRADEPGRVQRAKLSCAKERWMNRMPMADAGHTLDDVMKFWANNDFDLSLQQHEGNCDLCFLKGAAKIERILEDRPNLADWWADQEAKTGNTFRIDRPSYANMLTVIKEQGRFDYGCIDLDTCNCTD